jgi:hypothetical protein
MIELFGNRASCIITFKQYDYYGQGRMIRSLSISDFGTYGGRKSFSIQEQ